MKTAAAFIRKDHERLAQVAANQANELRLLLEQKAEVQRALTARRLEVADLRRRLGLPLDRECASELVRSAERRARTIEEADRG